MEKVEEMRVSVHDRFGYVSSHYHLDDRETVILERLPYHMYRYAVLETE